METVSDQRTNTRVIVGLSLMFAIAVSVAAYYVGDLGRFQERMAARESQAALQGITGSEQIDEALRQHPSNKNLKLVAMAVKASTEAGAAVEKLSREVEPAALANNLNPGTASRDQLEALRRDLKTAEANAAAFMPRYLALFKAERDRLEKDAASLNADKAVVLRFLAGVDRQHAELTALISRMLSARAEFYRAYENSVAVLVAEFGVFKVANGQFIFPLQRTADRYNAAANAKAAAAGRVAELDAERKALAQSQLTRWVRWAE